jgi:hypothetical protein
VPGLVSNFSLTDTFSTLPRASSLVSRFRALGLVLGGTDSAGSIFQVSRYQTHFRRYRWRWVHISVFKFRTLRHVFDATEGAESNFQLSR